VNADQAQVSDHLGYTTGVDRIQEAVISSHFMQKLAQNPALDVYDDQQLAAKSLEIDAQAVYDRLIPDILSACNDFCLARAVAAKSRAKTNYRKYGLSDPRDVGTVEYITEVMFDQQYLRGPRESCSREQLRDKVSERVHAGAPIEMVIPALPLKFFSPLKTRGRLPDLGELNFIFGLYEIAATIELIYRQARPGFTGTLARFTVVSDGSRFNRLINEPDSVVETYRRHLNQLILRLGLAEYIELLDYTLLLRDRLPEAIWVAKSTIEHRARSEYKELLWSIFDPYEMAGAMRAAALVEPDPESSNPEGRFVPLLKSLVYTINYRSLELKLLPSDQYCALYRDLAAHIFEPYVTLSHAELLAIQEEAEATTSSSPSVEVKEYLRQSMLREAWACAIDYMAEIKSARELPEDPILTCLPNHIRWTIHAKSGQLAFLTPAASGMMVQPWAGVAVFKSTKKTKIKLCTLPVLALEGVGAIPVTVSGDDTVLPRSDQPYFYLYPDLTFSDLDEFLTSLKGSLERKKIS
jgi:hypothetical protein